MGRVHAGGRDVKLGITEWNINAGNWGLGRGKLYTLGCGIFEARFLNLVHRNSDVVTLCCRSNLTNSFCGGTIQTNAAGLFRTPSFHVMRLYRRHSRPVPVGVAGAREGLDLSTCAAEDRGALTIFVVNARKDDLRAAVDLEAFGPGFAVVGGEVVADADGRRQIDIVNSFARPDRVRTMPLAPAADGTVVLPAFSVVAIECARR